MGSRVEQNIHPTAKDAITDHVGVVAFDKRIRRHRKAGRHRVENAPNAVPSSTEHEV